MLVPIAHAFLLRILALRRPSASSIEVNLEASVRDACDCTGFGNAPHDLRYNEMLRYVGYPLPSVASLVTVFSRLS
ncbi:hypothetical protein BD414DRAFT_496989 [Trametes punicea]|nr:hypothetical protein BD414DRAFT_496989 [Trametes punicea]